MYLLNAINLYSCKRNPGYFCDLKKYPEANPLITAVNFEICDYIRKLGGFCLWFSHEPEAYDLTFCNSKEIWILYIFLENFNTAEKLAHLMLLNNAKKVSIIEFNGDQLFCGASNGK